MDTFPYVVDRARSLNLGQESYFATPYSGDPKTLIRGNAKRAFSLIFTKRTQAEYNAAEAFWIAHYPYTHFIFADTRYFPTVNWEVVIVPGSTFREAGSDVTLRFNYAFDVIEP